MSEGKKFTCAKIRIDGSTFATLKEAAEAHIVHGHLSRTFNTKLNFLDQVSKDYKPKMKKLSSAKRQIQIRAKNAQSWSWSLLLGLFGTLARVKEADIASISLRSKKNVQHFL